MMHEENALIMPFLQIDFIIGLPHFTKYIWTCPATNEILRSSRYRF